jgi:hypothetical protein
MTGRDQVVHSDPEILGGTPVFVGTRVPVGPLFDYLEAATRSTSFCANSHLWGANKPSLHSTRRANFSWPPRLDHDGYLY